MLKIKRPSIFVVSDFRTGTDISFNSKQPNSKNFTLVGKMNFSICSLFEFQK